MSVPDRYGCQDVSHRLNDYLDRELCATDRQLVEEHLAACETCALRYRAEASVLDELRRTVRSVRLPPGLATRILAALRRAAQRGSEPPETDA